MNASNGALYIEGGHVKFVAVDFKTPKEAIDSF